MEKHERDETATSGQGSISCERELRKRAMKLNLPPLLGKAFRYVTVNSNGECKEVDEKTVQQRRESLNVGVTAGVTCKKIPLKKLRKPRQTLTTVDSSNGGVDARGGSVKPYWLPDSFTVTRISRTQIGGWVNSEQELAQVLSRHADVFSCKFVSWYHGRGLGNSFDPKRIAWKREDIEPDCPFTIDSYLVRHCQHGMKLKRLTEVRKSFTEPEKNEEGRRRSVACHARLKIRRVMLYEDFRLNPEDKTKKVMGQKMVHVKQMINEGRQMTTSSRIYVQLPLAAAHTSHSITELEESTDTEMRCEDGIKDTQGGIKNSLSVKQGDISYCDSKLDLKEMKYCDSSISDAFELEELPANETETNLNSWDTGQSFVDNSTSEPTEEHAKAQGKINGKVRLLTYCLKTFNNLVF
ncbi:hypothetical protein ElyMa_000140100 [Elysia marginata]|uniref:Uncharacterized protein n=1 Tax=Elysia marginata TaxID=1093978 RepID=A0AAV4ERN3_9GAST|nr:hypothetical protein ElyMa_000140100 [Elysia marginata]